MTDEELATLLPHTVESPTMFGDLTDGELKELYNSLARSVGKMFADERDDYEMSHKLTRADVIAIFWEVAVERDSRDTE